MMKRICGMILSAGLVVPLLAQQPAPQSATPSTQPAESSGDRIRPNYVLGPGDQIVIRAFQVDEISDKPFRLNSEGDLDLPVVGRVHAGGLTVERLEADLLERLKVLVKNPQVSVNVVQYRSEPIFLQGAFKSPGMYPLQGGRTLLEVVAGNGGLLPNASRRITVTRHLEFGKIQLPNAVVDTAKNVSTVQISIASLRDNISPAEDIILQPMDVISADRAEMVYVNGEVTRAGGIELGERDSISVTQLLAMVGGLAKDADPTKARVLRPVLDTSQRAKIPINVKKILAGDETDFPLLPNDVLYIPRNSHKIALGQVALIAVPMATGLIYVLASRL